MTLTTDNQHALRSLLAAADALALSKKARLKLQWFLFALEHDGNVSLTCRHFGIARSTFTRSLSRFDPTDERTLDDKSRRPHRVRTSRLDASVIERIADLRKQQPSLNKETISRMLAESGHRVSPSTVGRVIARHGLYFGERPLHRLRREQLGTRFTDTPRP